MRGLVPRAVLVRVNGPRERCGDVDRGVTRARAMDGDDEREHSEHDEQACERPPRGRAPRPTDAYMNTRTHERPLK